MIQLLLVHFFAPRWRELTFVLCSTSCQLISSVLSSTGEIDHSSHTKLTFEQLRQHQNCEAIILGRENQLPDDFVPGLTGQFSQSEHKVHYKMTRSLGALRAPTSSWRPFGSLDFVLRALRALRLVRRARLRSGPPFLTIFDHF